MQTVKSSYFVGKLAQISLLFSVSLLIVGIFVGSEIGGVIIDSTANLGHVAEGKKIDLTQTIYGVTALLIFVVAYIFVILEEKTEMRKSKPVLIGAGLIWAIIGIVYAVYGDRTIPHDYVKDIFVEYGELLLFLLVAMTYINTLQERRVFDVLKSQLISRGYTLRTLFWMTGLLAFFISPVADNLTTALLMCAVAMAVGGSEKKFIVPACINIVVAANAGGAFSPFGDITTLMVWQAGIVEFDEFFKLFVPSMVNWLIPAGIMATVVPKVAPMALSENVEVRKGGFIIMGLFVVTIITAVSFHNFLHLPPAMGMMFGLGYLKICGYFLKRIEKKYPPQYLIEPVALAAEVSDDRLFAHFKPKEKAFDVFVGMKRAEWDTLMFFYGVMFCVGGLGLIGYLAITSNFMYVELGATNANILVGVLSAIVDNIPVMYAVLTMYPEMAHSQWLLVTLTAGVGGSLLSIGSAAGVALMGQARGVYTFFSHLKWSWAIALGYAGSIYVHYLLNM